MTLESRVDILIIGAGPTGVMCANALAMAGVNTRIIDKRPVGVPAGQADGISPRTIEVLQSYGLAERVLKEGNQVRLFTFYNPDSNGTIKCTGRVPYVSDPTAPYPYVTTLRQPAIEAMFLDSLSAHGVTVERPRKPSALQISEDIEELSSSLSYPVKVTVEHLDATDDDNKTEVIHAKYVVGADGAHSWVRKTLGIEVEGEQTDDVWGVMDIVTESDFPDIQNISSVYSPNGSCLVVRREGGVNRLYIQLSQSSEKIDLDDVTPEKLLSVSRKILQPYKLADPKKVEWHSLYRIGRRLACKYSMKDRVFIAGDACHTHSPKGGQGMNAGINDAHNLGWKLAHVVKGWTSPSLLKTYEHERRDFALGLINLDREYTSLFSKKPKTAENEDGVSPEEYARMADKRGGFLTGLGIHYPPSAIVDTRHQNCAENLIVGKRMAAYQLLSAANVSPVNIHDFLPSDCRFKVFFFVGGLTTTRIAELESLAEELTKPASCLRRYSDNGDISSMFDIITIIAAKKHDMTYLSISTFFRPHWTKVLLDDTDLRNLDGGHAYEKFGIDPGQITLVVVRPDGYVGSIVPSSALEDLEKYLSSFLVSRSLDC